MEADSLPSGSPPSSSDYFTMIGPTLQALTVAACICTLLTMLLSVLQVYAICIFMKREYRRNLMLVVAFTMPIISICSAVGICIPRALEVTETFASIYLMSAFLGFMLLLQNLFESRGNMSIALTRANRRLVLRSTPLFCCCFCFPKLKPTERNIALIEVLILQAPFIRFWILAVRLVVILDNWGDWPATKISESITSALTVISTLLAIWGCQILMKTSAEVLTHYPVKRLFVLLQLLLILNNFQQVIFSGLAKTGVIPSDHVMAAKEWAKLYHKQLLTLEVLLVSIIATILLRPKFETRLYGILESGGTENESDEHLEGNVTITAD